MSRLLQVAFKLTVTGLSLLILVLSVLCFSIARSIQKYFCIYKGQYISLSSAFSRLKILLLFSGGSAGKDSACRVDLAPVPGSGRSAGEGNGYPPRHSGLENSTDRRSWRATVHGVGKSMLQLSRQTVKILILNIMVLFTGQNESSFLVSTDIFILIFHKPIGYNKCSQCMFPCICCISLTWPLFQMQTSSVVAMPSAQ